MILRDLRLHLTLFSAQLRTKVLIRNSEKLNQEHVVTLRTTPRGSDLPLVDSEDCVQQYSSQLCIHTFVLLGITLCFQMPDKFLSLICECFSPEKGIM